MIFNMWRKYPKRKPKVSGWYVCSMDVELSEYPLMVLFYDIREKKWFNRTRQLVFNGYAVYKSCRAPIPENRVFTDRYCEREDVIAWKKIPLIIRKDWARTKCEKGEKDEQEYRITI